MKITEIRTIAADDLWMSPCYRQACVGIHFTWKKNWEGVRGLLPEIEAALRPFQARPHWGKLFTMSAGEIARWYPKLNDFRALVHEFDPSRKFWNTYMDRAIGT